MFYCECKQILNKKVVYAQVKQSQVTAGDPLLFFATLTIFASFPFEAEADCV